MQKLYALLLLLLIALVACTSAASQQNQSLATAPSDTQQSERPRFLASYADW